MSDKPQYDFEKVMVGRLWMNEDKGSSKAPDMNGNLVLTKDLEEKDGDYKKIPELDKLAVSLWKNTDEKGTKYVSISVSKKTPKKDKDSDLPF